MLEKLHFRYVKTFLFFFWRQALDRNLKQMVKKGRLVKSGTEGYKMSPRGHMTNDVKNSFFSFFFRELNFGTGGGAHHISAPRSGFSPLNGPAGASVR